MAVIWLMTGCSSPKNIIYFQDIDSVLPGVDVSTYEPRIRKDDLLNIIVTAPMKDAVQPYNMTLSDAQTSLSNPETATIPYLVDKDGNINFPTLGKIHVEGMRRVDLVEYLTEKLSGAIIDPLVVISFVNFRVTVLGEVGKPGTYNMPSERTTILQALGQAGDLTITARRSGILLIREVNGKKVHYELDLRNAGIFSSPCYYVVQNDVIYVPPTKSRIANSSNVNSIWAILLSTISTITTILAITLK